MAKKSGPHFATLDINSVIEEIVVLTRNELTKHNVILRTELFSGDRRVLADPVQLQQVVVNLIMNGIEAMSAVVDRPKMLTICSERIEQGGVLVTVKDTGIGIDPTLADRIFDSLFTTKPNGMGMGLSICRTIIRAHGGDLSASPNTPYGAIFQFTLPADGRDSTGRTQTASAS
jgi:signal transduction histidine kinase